MIAKHRKRPGFSIGKHHYTGGIALMAIAEAYGMSEGHPMAKEIGVVAQECVDWAVKSQNTNGSYGYVPNSVRSDQSVSGWWVMGLKSAYVAGLRVPDKTFKKALKFHRSWTMDTGESGYEEAGNGTTNMSAAANTILQFLGDQRTNKKVIATAEFATQDKFLPGARKQNFYLMYYQALAFFQMVVRVRCWWQ